MHTGGSVRREQQRRRGPAPRRPVDLLAFQKVLDYLADRFELL
jgi:hypothetical protein